MEDMDEEFLAIYCTVRDAIYEALGHDVKIELLMPPAYRSNKRGASRKHTDRMFDFYSSGGTCDD